MRGKTGYARAPDVDVSCRITTRSRLQRSALNMCNVPPKFYRLCRLCLSSSSAVDGGDGDINDPLSIFADAERNIPTKIMTCLSIMVGDSSSSTSYIQHPTF